MLSHGHLFHVPLIRPFRTIWLITPTQISSEGQESWKTIWYRNIFPKQKRSKQQQRSFPRFHSLCPGYSWEIHASTAYAPAIHGKYMLPQPMPRLFMANTCNFSHHKQRRIYQFIITWNTRNTILNW